MSALCQFRGMLVLFETKPAPDGGSCPNCGGQEFKERAGWVWCYGCHDFAVAKEHAYPIPEE